MSEVIRKYRAFNKASTITLTIIIAMVIAGLFVSFKITAPIIAKDFQEAISAVTGISS